MKTGIYKNTIRVYDKLGAIYLKESSKIPPRKRAAFAKILPKKSHILDAGCGGGRDSEYFTRKGMNVTGIDLSEGMLRIAKKKTPQAKFLKRDILKMDFKPEIFDAIWAQASLLHLKREDAAKAVKTFYTILKPGGVIHIAVKKGKGEALVKEKLSGWNQRFYTYFSKAEVEKIVEDSGFDIIFSAELSDEMKRPGVKWIVVWGRK